jgi:hypothetical protein
MKKCSKCGIEKPLTSFYYDYKKADKKRPDCKSCFNERMKKTRKTLAYKIYYNPYQKEWQREYRKTPKYKEWRKKEEEQRRNKSKEYKKNIIDHYGGECKCCGITNIKFLTIDHINNDGFKLKNRENGKKVKNRGGGYLYYEKIIKNNYPSDLQILCFNCNIARQQNGGICPHKIIN